MARLHLTYRKSDIDPTIIELTRRFLASRPWHEDVAQILPLYSAWAHGAALFYELPPVTVRISPAETNGVGKYVPADGETWGTIILHRPSVISLLHQFRHHMQANVQPDAFPYDGEDEAAEDAQAWACSLFYIVAPYRFRRMVRARRVAGVHPPDLLKTRRSR